MAEPPTSLARTAAQPATANATPKSPAPSGPQRAPHHGNQRWRRKHERAQLADRAPHVEAARAGGPQSAQGPPAQGGCGPRHAKTHAQPSRQEKVAVVVRGADGKAYRRSVQCFFVNEQGNVLLFTPVGPCNADFRQTVQGGADVGESPQQTARREAWEETGLHLDSCATFVCEVLPSSDPAPVVASSASAETRNDKNEIVCELRQQFRYRSKSWAKQGIFGQELYPLLYFLQAEAIQAVQVHASRRGCWTEFKAVEWGPLRDAMDRAPPSKKVVMQAVCRAVAAAARTYLEAKGLAFDGLQGLLGEGELAEATPSPP